MPTAVISPIEQPPKSAIKGIKGDIDNEQLGTLRPSTRDTPIAELQQRLEEDGYLFIKNLIPRGEVLKVRKKYVSGISGANTSTYIDP